MRQENEFLESFLCCRTFDIMKQDAGFHSRVKIASHAVYKLVALHVGGV